MENKFKFYNTLTRNIDTLIPNVDGKISMYTCGPTVYHFAHIGNLRSYKIGRASCRERVL